MIRVLFVCTGNTCRSPMAAAILKSKGLPGVDVRSAGVFADHGSAASNHAQTVLEEKQIGEPHSSTLLTENLVDWATHIITMTMGHKVNIVRSYPHATSKTFTLKELAGGSGDVSDPFGGSLKTYQQTYAELEHYIDRIIGKLT